MLTNLKNKMDALKAFSFEGELKRIVSENKDKLADLQASQLAKGINSKGEEINPQYSPYTIEQKKKKTGLAGVYSRVTYFDTGALYKSLFTQINGDKFSIKSESFKFTKMVNRSGKNVVGLNIESRRDFVQEITRPQILAAYKEKVTDI